uniref:Uncharacterized protein n=1 Tax=Oryza sativa subsp. japonica TaxID=39947 RepID=Q5VME2_ORYSJ|nr:hypothetical protein [Oryza sativa Japonica Group]
MQRYQCPVALPRGRHGWRSRCQQEKAHAWQGADAEEKPSVASNSNAEKHGFGPPPMAGSVAPGNSVSVGGKAGLKAAGSRRRAGGLDRAWRCQSGLPPLPAGSSERSILFESLTRQAGPMASAPGDDICTTEAMAAG